ncbi:hypothetical protein OSTOST_10129 [Ostertagia ostertagi]
MLVSKAKEELIILGTNAISRMGYELKKRSNMKDDEEVEQQRNPAEENPAAVVARRVFIAPGQTGCVDLQCKSQWSEAILNTEDDRIPDGLCQINAEGIAKVAVVNTTEEPIVMQKGEKVGKWEDVYWDKVRLEDTTTDLLCNQSEPMSENERLKTIFSLLVRNRDGRTLSLKMQQIVEEKNQVFAVEDSELTQTTLVAHDIDTGDTKPIRQKTRPVPIGTRDEFREILSSLLQRGIIERSTSEWASPVVLVRKKDGTIRLCIDYQLLGGLQLIREEVQAKNEKYRAKMKEVYDKRKNVDVLSLPAVGGRVFMKLPREKARGKHPKLTVDWDGPYRVLQTDETSALITKIGSNEDALKVQKEHEFDVPDDGHILHAQFRCRGQDFPALKGGPSFTLASCCLSKTLTAGDLITALPHPARAMPIECVLEAARVFTIWTQPGSLALKAQRITNLEDKVIDPRALGFAYALFRSKCAHVSNMARAIEPATIMRHGSLTGGWPTVPRRIFELGWLIARKVDWKDFDSSSMLNRVHNRVLLVVPIVLRRMAWMSGGCRTRVFYYDEFSAIKTKNDSLFTDDLGAVVLVLPPEEPRKVTAWLAAMSAIDLWTACGTTVYLVNGPRTPNVVSWEHVTIKMRSHVLNYVSEHPERAQLVVDVLQQSIGIMDTRAAWAAVGILRNAEEWMSEESTRTFYQFLRLQLEPMLTLEELRLATFRAHKRREPGPPALPKESSGGFHGVNRKHRRRAMNRLRDKIRATTHKMQEL